MSTRPDVVGRELADELEKLQTKVPADDSELVAELIREELGQPIDEIFAEFSPEPVASASIGQVHRGTLNSGDEVAVKVQHHGIEQQVRVDLDILTGLAQLAERIPELRPYRPRSTVAEFQRAPASRARLCARAPAPGTVWPRISTERSNQDSSCLSRVLFRTSDRDGVARGHSRCRNQDGFASRCAI